MAVVQSDNGLVNVAKHPSYLNALPTTSLHIFDGRAVDYGTLYQTQHEVRTVVDFLARNVSQIPLHAFLRTSDTSRERVTGTPLADTIARPDVLTTRARWMEALVKDLAIYDAAYRVKVRSDTDGRVALVRVPSSMVAPIGSNWLRPEGFRVTGMNGTVDYDRSEVVYLHGYNPSDPRKGLSPLETLRQLLSEQLAAAEHREGLWRHGARAALVIERPNGAPPWSDAARARFRAEWEASYTGAANSGKTAVLEEGMTAKPLQAFSPRDAQYFESTQLAREIVAAAYGVPAGLLGLGNVNYASLTEQHRQLYTDCLAPWLTVIAEELEAQLLPDFDNTDSVYLEFQLAEKLRGSFEEQAAVLQASVGAPYLSRNEARARLNLPALEGGDELVTPLNVLVGGLASPQDTAPSLADRLGAASDQPEAKAVDDPKVKARRDDFLRLRKTSERELRDLFRATAERQRRSVLSKLGAAKAAPNLDDVYDRERFDTELAADLDPALRKIARRAARTVGPWEPDNADDYFSAVAQASAVAANDVVAERLTVALADDDARGAVEKLFDAIGDAPKNAVLSLSLANSVSNFGRTESAQANGVRTKTWIVTSGNPRSSHIALDGETVAMSEDFSNGAPWPGHQSLPEEERINCACIVDFGE